MSNTKTRNILTALLLGAIPALAVQPAASPAVGPAVQFSPNPVNFGLVPSTHHSILTLTITNVGTSNLIISHDEVPASLFQFYIQTDACAGKSIAPGKSCEVEILWSPQDPFARAWDYYVVFDNASGGYQYVLMYGTSQER